MNRKFLILGFALLLLPLAAFGATKLSAIAAKNPGKTMAVVSISANNYMGALRNWSAISGTDLMSSRLNEMLETTETVLSADWTIIKADTFAAKAEFQALAAPRLEVGLPNIGGSELPLFCKNRQQLVKADIDKDLVQKLAAVIGADYVAVVYAEWSVVTGKMIPTSKAVSKNVVTVYDSQGKDVFSGRSDDVGAKTLGANAVIAVNDQTIDQWVDAYAKGITKLFKEGRK